MRRELASIICLLLLHLGTATASSDAGVYYCLEDYTPIGTVLREVPITKTTAAPNSNTSVITGGQVARQCAAACDAASECTGFRSVGPEVKDGGTCELLSNSTQSLPAALAFGADTPWPEVNANLTAADHIALRSISWMCWRQQQDWDTFGAATHNMIVLGNVQGEGSQVEHTDWCAFGVDVAGTNLRRDFINITRPAQCDSICRNNATGCTMWIFVASQPEQVQFQPARNCFAKADAFRGQNGWTGKPKSDIWIADSQVTCFNNLPDWRHLGLVLSPSIKTIQQGSTYYTVYPERVLWSEAAATCKQLPGGQLAILDSQGLVDKVSRDLLDTLPFQTAVRSAWVGATGNNTAFNPAAPNISEMANGSLQAQIPPREQPATPPEATLKWAGGAQVAPGLLRRPNTLTSLWTVHDVVWSQQYVPESSRDVCGRVMVQLPSSTGPVDPASVLPGVWYYDCAKPAAFICQSTLPPTEPMNGREVTPSKVDDSNASNRSDPGGGSGLQPWKTALAVVLPVLVVALLAYHVFRVYSRKMSRLPEIIRQQRKRALGQPRTGRMSLVMTDIQGFTRLMEASPDPTTQALLLHNSIIKHAVYQNVGWVVEQEGDSFSVVFHEAEDAVAFTLQVQQALLAQNWPRGVGYSDDWEGATSFLECRTASQKQPDESPAPVVTADADAGTPQGQGSFTWQEQEIDPAVAAGSASQASSCSMGLAAMGQQLRNMRPGGRSNSFTVPSTGKGANHRRSQSLEFHDQQQPQLDAPQRVDSTVSAVSNNSGTNSVKANRQSSVTSEDSRSIWHWGRGHSPSISQFVASPPSFAGSAPPTAGGPSPHSKKSGMGSRPRNLWLFQQLLSPRQEQQKLFSGLRVRMGVVTGEVERGQDLKSSNLYRNAQDVSGAAHGGQVLMDEPTFTAVKEALWRLGAVGPNGLDYDALLATKSARHSMSGSSGNGSCMGDGCLPSLGPGGSLRRDGSGFSDASSQLPSTTRSTLAVALDMGCYEVLTPSDPAYPGRTNSSSGSPLGNSKGTACVQLWTRELGDKLVQQYQQYIQLRLSRQGELDLPEEGLDNSFDEEAPYMMHARLGAVQVQQAEKAHQHQHQHQQQPHLGLAGLRQLSVVGRGSRGLGSQSGQLTEHYSGGMSKKHQQQSPHGLVGRSASMTVPHSWQHISSSLFGVGSMPAGPASTSGGSGADVPISSLKADRRSLVGFCSISAVLRRNVRLYQVVAPTLAGRAALFGQQLDLPTGWRVLDLPYFAAPGLSSASLLAAQEAAASEAAADSMPDQTRGRVPGRMSSEFAPWQQARLPGRSSSDARLPGRSSSDAYALSKQQQSLQQKRAISASEISLLAAVQQQQQQEDAAQGPVPPTTPSPVAAAGQANAPATPSAVGDVVGGAVDGAATATATAATGEAAGPGMKKSSSSPFLDAAQHRLSSSEDGSADKTADVAAAAAAAAAAAVGPQGNSRQASTPAPDQQQQQQPMSWPLARVHSSSTHGGQLGLLMSPQHYAAPMSPLSPSAGTGPAGMASAQSLLVLRAASLQLNVAPSVLLASSNGDRRGGGGQRRVSGPARALFPPVTILFAAVEGSGELLRYPALARSVHAMVHHLMLQLLRAFPGSYLVRAQQGDLKYMLAFTSPAAAVSWGLTLQEASLYLPYPQEVLGLSSCGVQLDEGGRLVFRGPRFKMGLSEGTPKVIMPDHLGRADYHGSFVNLAARYAAVAAQGGQLVTDAELARQVLSQWKTSGYASGQHNGYTMLPDSVTSQADTFGSLSGFSALRSQTSTGTNALQWTPLLLHQQGSLPALPPSPAAEPAGSESAAGSSSGTFPASPIAGAASGAPRSADMGASDATAAPVRTSSSHVLVIQPDDSTAVSVFAGGPQSGAVGNAAGAAAGATAEVPVECCWLGSFLFKGNPSPVSMVNFSPAVLSGRHYAPPAMSSSKGVRVLQRVGVMDRAVVRLPAAVEGFGPWEELHERRS